MTEKLEAIKLVEQLKDVETLRLIRRILTAKHHDTLDEAIERGTKDSSDNKVIAHEKVMSVFKEKYK